MRPFSLVVITLLIVLLPACGEKVVKPDLKPQDPIFQGVEVPVPVKEKCVVDIPLEPTWQVEVSSSNTTTSFEKSKAVLAELEQRRDYISQLLAAARKCE